MRGMGSIPVDIMVIDYSQCQIIPTDPLIQHKAFHWNTGVLEVENMSTELIFFAH